MSFVIGLGFRAKLPQSIGVASHAHVPEPILKAAEEAEYASGVDCTEEEEYERMRGIEPWKPDDRLEVFDGPWMYIPWGYLGPSARTLLKARLREARK